MLQKLPIANTQVKAGNISKILLNEIARSYIICIEQKRITKKVYCKIMNSIQLSNTIDTIFMNFCK